MKGGLRSCHPDQRSRWQKFKDLFSGEWVLGHAEDLVVEVEFYNDEGQDTKKEEWTAYRVVELKKNHWFKIYTRNNPEIEAVELNNSHVKSISWSRENGHESASRRSGRAFRIERDR